MPNRLDYASIEVPRILHDRLRLAKEHHRQPYWEVIESMLDFWEERYGFDPSRRPPAP